MYRLRLLDVDVVCCNPHSVKVLVASKATCTQVAQNGQNRFRVFAVFLLVGRCPNPPYGAFPLRPLSRLSASAWRLAPLEKTYRLAYMWAAFFTASSRMIMCVPAAEAGAVWRKHIHVLLRCFERNHIIAGGFIDGIQFPFFRFQFCVFIFERIDRWQLFLPFVAMLVEIFFRRFMEGDVGVFGFVISGGRVFGLSEFFPRGLLIFLQLFIADCTATN